MAAHQSVTELSVHTDASACTELDGRGRERERERARERERDNRQRKAPFKEK